MKRTASLRRHRRVGEAARERILAGGPTSVHREALSTAGYRTLSRMKFESQAWRCGWCGHVKPLELEHAINRSQGGPDAWASTWGCCADCHALKLRPFSEGRLLTMPLQDGLIDLLWVVGTKWDYDIKVRKIVGRAPTSAEREILAAVA